MYTTYKIPSFKYVLNMLLPISLNFWKWVMNKQAVRQSFLCYWYFKCYKRWKGRFKKCKRITLLSNWMPLITSAFKLSLQTIQTHETYCCLKWMFTAATLRSLWVSTQIDHVPIRPGSGTTELFLFKMLFQKRGEYFQMFAIFES